MEIFEQVYDCIVGSQLNCISKEIRYNVKTDQRVLRTYNPAYLVLKDNAECAVGKLPFKLEPDEYVSCMKVLRDAGYTPTDVEGNTLCGERIFCEYHKKTMLPSKKRQQVVLHGRIAVAVISKKEVQSGIYRSTERWVRNPKLGNP